MRDYQTMSMCGMLSSLAWAQNSRCTPGETWPISRDQIHKLNQQHMIWLRKITGITRRKHHEKRLKDRDIRKLCKMDHVEEMLHRRVLRWTGHVARMPKERLPKQLMFAWHPHGVRSSKNSMSRYKFRLAEALRSREIDIHIWLQLANDKTK